MEIGEAIAAGEDEQQKTSKFKEFATDPKNLATMLVLGAALAAPKRPGYSNLAHALRGGVSAMGFRGGIDAAMMDRDAKESEAASQDTYRKGQISTAQEANEIDRFEQGVEMREGELDRRNDAQMRQAMLSAQEREAALQRETQMFQMQYNGYLAAAENARMMGQPVPDPRQFITAMPTGFSWGMTGAPSEPMPTAEVETPEQVQKKVTTKPPDPLTSTPAEREQFQRSQRREQDLEGRSYAATKIPKSKDITDAGEAELLRKKYKAWRDLPDNEVLEQARQTDQILEEAMRSGVTNWYKLEDLYKRSIAASPEMREKYLQYYRNIKKEEDRKVPKAL